ncbi:putative CRISPR-associated protein [Dapis sp. BLCC M126]|uniref:putative CRISPR-associated protein n=1 Tax=Dapis sp. BLCC M126 TaxID=3400189 RepID=UPI003CF85A8F
MIENRVVISTVGTSLLTNQIDDEFEPDWDEQLQETTNLSLDELENEYPEVAEIIEELKTRAEENLEDSNTIEIREISAELNNIYGLYEEEIQRGKQDIHYLITTDTAQGITSGKILENFLKSQGIVNTNIYTPPGLSTANTQKFSEGVDKLITFLSKERENWQGYKICFNLVGGFKTLQGYLNTIGMFYADEIIYIFEGKRAELIVIPRLPIAVDNALIKPHVIPLALMGIGAELNELEVQEIPEALITDRDGKKELSTWGELIWEEAKKDLLAEELLDFVWLDYKDTFRADYNKIKDKKEKVQLHETLAEVSYNLKKYNGDTSVLVNTGIKYDPYEGTEGIDHFRVTKALRISCKKMENGKLSLRYYGTHDHVQGKELKKKK